MRRPHLLRLLPFAFSLAAICCAVPSARAQVPIVTDSRIKTFVYNPNEVFTLTTHYGYQSNIEFGPKERIEAVSVGDRVAWQIIPAGERLFIRAQEENAHTNMTVITNERAYQFDLRSSDADAVFGSEELVYVLRFYYPDRDAMAGITPVSYAAAPIQAATVPPPPVATGAIPAAAREQYNYRYTFSGPPAAAPVKIYDDGRSTYFKFRSTNIPQFSVVTARGEELSVPYRPAGEGSVAVDMIAPRFSLRSPAGQVIVYNESHGA